MQTYVRFFALMVLTSTLYAEDIQLKDGTKISGTLVAVNTDTFQIKTAYGEIKVPRVDVVSISFPENQAATPSPVAPVSVSPVEESFNGTNYTNRTVGFQLTTPTGWALAPEMRKKEISAALKSPDQTLFFIATQENFVGTLATYKVLAETQYQNKFADYQQVEESPAQLDGHNAVRIIFNGKPDKTTPMKCLVYIIAYDGRMVRLTFLTLEPLFNNSIPVFERIASSYRSVAQHSEKKEMAKF